MPSLEELYVASCITHYAHFVNMFEKSIGGLRGDPRVAGSESVRYSERTKRLLYVGKVLPGRVSPLQLMIQNTNSVGPENYARVAPDTSDSLLIQLEYENADRLGELDVRTCQRLLSLAFFGKLNAGEPRPKRVCESDFDKFNKNSKIIKNQLRSFRKKARLDFIAVAEANPRGLRFKKLSK